MRGLIVAAEPCGYGELEEIPVESGKGQGVFQSGHMTGFTISTLRPSASTILKNSPTPGSTQPFSILEIYDFVVPAFMASSF